MTKSRIVNFEDIKKVLPHRYPFLLVDRILSVDEHHIKAIKNVTANEPFFMGHFPKMSVMPGVLQIEALAQAAGLILALDSGFDVEKEIAFLAGIHDAKFKKIVTPGDQLILNVDVVARKKGLLKVSATATVDEHVTSTVSIVLVIKPL